jgi:hypothetical protein
VHTRRISTFLLGGWIGCSVFMAFVVLESLHSASLVMNSPVEPVAKIVKTLGADQLELLLKHHAAEQSRNLNYIWEETQVLIGLALGVCLYFATQKRLLSLVLCSVMLGVVMFQLFAITPELNYLGRETDFAPGGASPGVVRSLILYQLLLVSEGLKLIVGGVLASYLFSFKTSRTRTSRHRLDSEVAVDSQL